MSENQRKIANDYASLLILLTGEAASVLPMGIFYIDSNLYAKIG